MAYDLGENRVLFEISRNGEVQSNPRNWTISTSHEMQVILEDMGYCGLAGEPSAEDKR